jgi:hypothetical protein
VIPALSQNDTSDNPHNPMYGIFQAGARGSLLNLIGTDSSTSGGNSVAPPNMINVAAQPTKIADGSDTAGLVNTGQLSTLLPTSSDVTNVLESMKRISDAKYGAVTAYSSSIPASAATNMMDGATLNANALGASGAQACAYTKSAYLLNQFPSSNSVDPDFDTAIVGPTGIFNQTEYSASSDFQKTAAVMKLVVNGYAAAGTIQLDGFDYHTGERATGEARDFDAGTCIGAVLQYAAIKGKPVMIYVFSDGSLASDGTIDDSVGGRGKGVWTADNQNVAATYFLIYNPAGQAQTAQANVEMSKQLGYMTPAGSQMTTSSPAGNNVPNLVQMVVLNYMALHSANAAAAWPLLWPSYTSATWPYSAATTQISGPNTINTLGSGTTALDPLIMWQPLAGLQNGKVPA